MSHSVEWSNMCRVGVHHKHVRAFGLQDDLSKCLLILSGQVCVKVLVYSFILQ
jgi:hypothetical protein